MGRKRNVPHPPPATCSKTPEPSYSPNHSPRVQARADVFHQGAAPSQAPPGPPHPSPCSVCEACLQRQQAPHTVRGAPPMMGLQESRIPFLPLDPTPPTQSPHFSSRLAGS